MPSRFAPRLAVALAVVLIFPACDADQAGPQSPAPAEAAPASPPAAQAPSPARRHLSIKGAAFFDGDRPFEWRGISAFRLVEMIAAGREAEAVAYLDWAREQKLTVVRVFLMAHHLFELAPQAGLKAAPRLLELAAARGLHVELVPLIDTAEIDVDMEQHVKAAGAIAASHPNALLEIANEPWHPTQDRRLHDPAVVRSLAGLVPREVPVALGSVERNAGYAEGDYVTWHSPRGGSDGWRHVLAIAEGAGLIERFRKPVIGDEPIGASADAIAGRRDNAPPRFAAAAALTRLAGLGATFHYEGGLQARVPSGRELESFLAWSSGLDLLEGMPAGGTFQEGEALAPVATVTGARGAFGRVYDAEAWIVAVEPSPHVSARPGSGWTIDTAGTLDGVRVFRGRR